MSDIENMPNESINQQLLKLLNAGCKLCQKAKRKVHGRKNSSLKAHQLLSKAALKNRLSSQEMLFQQRYQQALSKLKLCQYQLTRSPSRPSLMPGTNIPMHTCKAHF